MINKSEADTVRQMFERYAQNKSVPDLVDELAAQGIRTRERKLKTGKTVGGIFFKTGTLMHLLQNPVYIGKMRHHDKIYDGVNVDR